MSYATAQQTVNQTYQDVLGREADATGLSIYTPMVARGKLDADSLATTIKASPEYASKTGLNLVDPSQAFKGDQGGSELLGQLNRAQWTDWKSRFAPRISELANLATDPNAANQAAADASSAMGLAFDANQQSLAQDRQSFGISQTPAQQEAEQRRSNIQRSASMVSAGNQARISALDRQSAILAGGMGLSNIPDKVMDS